MCIIFFAINKHSHYPFILASNRDESAQRSTLYLNCFEQDSNIYGGRDLVEKGTWLGINKQTKLLACLTNIFEMNKSKQKKKSRGELPYFFLKTQNFINEVDKDEKISQELQKILASAENYFGFNLLVYNIQSNRAFYINNKQINKGILQIQKNVYYAITPTVISNEIPKAVYGKQVFDKIITQTPKQELTNELCKLLKDQKEFNVPPFMETSIFVKPYFNKILGYQRKTRSSTIILCSQNKQVLIKEISYEKQNSQHETIFNL